VRILLVTILVLAVITSVARGQNTRRLRVAVTSASGRSVFLNQGRAAGIVPGLRVRLFPPTGGPVEGVVRDVSTNSARVELPPGIPLPPPGSRGELELPAEQVEPQEEGPPSGDGEAARQVPEHPPWTRQEEERTPDTPLLSPAFSQRPQDRTPRINGRIFGQTTISVDEGNGRDNSYSLSRLGAWLEATNPLGLGGRFRFAGEVNYRTFDVVDDDDTDLKLILDQASYAVGGQEYAPYRLEFGRFMPVNLSEIGIIDGGEGVVQLENGLRVGAGFGVYPRPFPERDWGDDLSLHVFVDYQSDAPHKLSGVLGYQKTWHEGDSDRDQLLGRLNVKPADSLWLYTAWRADIYTSSDEIKGEGIELTELWAQARYAPSSRNGAALSYSYYTWPELKRREYDEVTPELIRDGKVDRAGLSAWHTLGESFRLAGRVDYWRDQNDSGLGGEVSADLDDPTDSWPALRGVLFYSDGSFIDGVGLRLEARGSIGKLDVRLGYEAFNYSNDELGGDDDFIRHSIRAGLDWSAGNWYYDLNGEFFTGDGEDAYTVGLYAEYRF
jgi:hypothetical protein